MGPVCGGWGAAPVRAEGPVRVGTPTHPGLGLPLCWWYPVVRGLRSHRWHCLTVRVFKLEFFMKPVSRYSVNKAASASKFRKSVSKTKSVNLLSPIRGGWRL